MPRFIIVLFTLMSSSVFAQLPNWSYDPGPNPEDKMGRELIDLVAGIPNMPAISKKIMGKKQKFRPAFGPIPWRMRLDKNAVKVLFMGQDGTHIAEAAGRPATAGFGGRAQDFANYFGVNEGAAFINAYPFTIKGQYGVYNSPYLVTNGEKESWRNANLVSNNLWLMSNNLDSPMVMWRNQLIDWIIRNNKDSVKLIVLFGGAARDAIATYAKSKGIEVYGRYEKQMKDIQVPLLKEEYAGGNNTFPSMLSLSGKDLYSELAGRRLDYTRSKNQKEALNFLKNQVQKVKDNAIFTKAGPHKNGLLNSAQLGGYDLNTMKVDGMVTRSLKGIKLNDGTILENDLIIISLPHPSSLSRTVIEADSYAAGKAAANKRVMRDVKVLDKYRAAGWEITPDINKRNFYNEGKSYDYGRSDIGPEFYDFGTPRNRMVSKSTARRMGGAANVVIIGTRDNGKFDKKKIRTMTEAASASQEEKENLFISRPRIEIERYVFDSGPGAEMARVMTESLDFSRVSEPKKGMSFKEDGIAAFNIKSHPSVGVFGHYRGTFKNPKVVFLADPIGFDDIITARALSGSRGQYIQGMMNDLGLSEKYLVVKTVPFGMDGATREEWTTVIEQTKNYRDAIFAKILENAPELIVTDGENAYKEALRLLKGSNIKIVKIERDSLNASSGVRKAGIKLAKALGIEASITGKIADIPRAHLSFYSRTWEGTSGDRVITSKGLEYEGIAFAEVVPSWAYSQNISIEDDFLNKVEKLLKILVDENLPLPHERIPTYLRRIYETEGSDHFRNFFLPEAA